VKTTDLSEVNIEEAAAEDDQDRRDHRKLAGLLEQLLKHEDVMRLPIAVRRLVDAGVDPVVVAKTLLVGDRGSGLLYQERLRVPVFALAEHEQIAVDWISVAIREIEPDLGATTMVTGAVWLAIQFGLPRGLLAWLVTNARRRELRVDRRGYGVVDLVDHHGVGDRASIANAIGLAQLPMFAPLEGATFKVKS
jgi:hypothetical protein